MGRAGRVCVSEWWGLPPPSHGIDHIERIRPFLHVVSARLAFRLQVVLPGEGTRRHDGVAVEVLAVSLAESSGKPWTSAFAGMKRWV